VSSSFSTNPIALKEEVASKAMKRTSIDPGSLRKDPMRAITLFGDPMMPCVIGLAEGFLSSGKDVILAGGTQMGAVAAALKELDVHEDIAIATTKYVFDDTSARFGELIDSLEIAAFSAYPNFSRSAVRALQYYERGEVKEGVGAGGAMALACLSGYSQAVYRREVESVVKQLK
jgi:NaMN:DMB phosphoribosyltransferase